MDNYAGMIPWDAAIADADLDLTLADLQGGEPDETDAIETIGGQQEKVEACDDTAAKPPNTPKERKAAFGPPVHGELSTFAAEAFVLSPDEAPADLEVNEASVIGTRPTLKKVAVTFKNVITALAAGCTPSTLVINAYNVLKAKGL
ncbi:hypothetical protein GCM10007874_72760 [Labrys miyagiensis]|uniref:Uncharacterized protein n=1 Tax=Labrys miyagiensis TaxID=346912 RepID=A0ABQ6CWY9_9HYPH|nr:hypothetical protein [Labrys miyagiensis]GLS24255.1 hypothetical protein GCM10007874_72760 [Labrys miyagiensis]